jgi:predicted nucleotidyltransferase
MDYKKFTKILKENENILALGLKGSFAYGYEDKYSDLDLFLIIKNSYSLEGLIKEVKKLNVEIHPHPEILKNLNSFSIKASGKQIDLEIIKKKDFKNKRENYLKIIYDPLKILKNSKIIKSSRKDFEFQCRMIVYPLRIKKHFEVCKYRRNNLFLWDIIHTSLESLIKIVYALNKKEYVCLKWAKNDLENMKKKPDNFEKKLEKIISLKNEGKELENKINKIYKIGIETYNLIERDYPSIKKIKDHVDWIDELEVKEKLRN